MKAFLIWWRAVFLNYPYWRVKYKDGKRTRPLYWVEAKGLSDVFNGKIFIDYETKI